LLQRRQSIQRVAAVCLLAKCRVQPLPVHSQAGVHMCCQQFEGWKSSGRLQLQASGRLQAASCGPSMDGGTASRGFQLAVLFGTFACPRCPTQRLKAAHMRTWVVSCKVRSQAWHKLDHRMQVVMTSYNLLEPQRGNCERTTYNTDVSVAREC
jgi:hypothetical protein